MQVVILTGGLATRLYPETKKIPKSLIGIAGKPFIYWQLKNLKEQGIIDVILCVKHLSSKIRDYVKNGSQFGMKIKYSYDGEQALGTGGAIKKALNLLDDKFFVLYGDSYLDVDYFEILNSKMTYDKLGVMTIFKNDNELEQSNVILRDNEIIMYDKNFKSLEMTYIDYGLGIFKKQAFNPFLSNSFDLSEVYNYLINIKQLANYKVSKRFYEIGSKEGIKETEKYILRKNRGK